MLNRDAEVTSEYIKQQKPKDDVLEDHQTALRKSSVVSTVGSYIRTAIFSNNNVTVLQTARCLKTEVQRETRKMKDSIAEKTKERWHGKRMHGQLPRHLDGKLVDIEQSYRWLKSGDIKGETESTVVAAQDQAIGTNYVF